MIIGLFSLIVVRGLHVFWPKNIATYHLKEDAKSKMGPNAVLSAIEVKKVQKKLAGAEEGPAEFQIFIGNKDVYGLPFKFLPEAEIARIEYEKDVMIVERLEYGDAILKPVELMLEDGTRIKAGSKNFIEKLHEAVEIGTDRRLDILKIEKGKIGVVSDKIANLKDDIARYHYHAKKKGTDPSEKVAKAHEKIEKLESEFATFSGEARDLHELQEKAILSYRLASGQEKSMPVAEIVEFALPNQLNFSGKVKSFAHSFWGFLSQNPREANTEGGIFPAIFGTFMMTVLMSIAVMPFGVIGAIYLREYAKQGPLVRIVRICVNNLAGVPSIVFGVFGLGFFIYVVGHGIDDFFYPWREGRPTWGTGGILWASLTLALMTLPVVIVATEEALAAVPRGVREAALACGASKWQMIQRVVLPTAAPGILTGLILAMARGAGEVAPLMLVGVVKVAPSLPVAGSWPFGMDQKFMHLGFHIYDLGFQSPDAEAAKPMVFATTFFLILLVVLLNLGAIRIRNILRKKYAAGTF